MALVIADLTRSITIGFVLWLVAVVAMLLFFAAVGRGRDEKDREEWSGESERWIKETEPWLKERRKKEGR